LQNREKVAWLCVAILLVSIVASAHTNLELSRRVKEENYRYEITRESIELLKKGMALAYQTGGAVPRVFIDGFGQGWLVIPKSLNLSIREAHLLYNTEKAGHQVLMVPPDNAAYSVTRLKFINKPVGAVFVTVFLLSGQAYSWLVIVETVEDLEL